jgi:hypothetical protein
MLSRKTQSKSNKNPNRISKLESKLSLKFGWEGKDVPIKNKSLPNFNIIVTREGELVQGILYSCMELS